MTNELIDPCIVMFVHEICFITSSVTGGWSNRHEPPERPDGWIRRDVLDDLGSWFKCRGARYQMFHVVVVFFNLSCDQISLLVYSVIYWISPRANRLIGRVKEFRGFSVLKSLCVFLRDITGPNPMEIICSKRENSASSPGFFSTPLSPQFDHSFGIKVLLPYLIYHWP